MHKLTERAERRKSGQRNNYEESEKLIQHVLHFTTVRQIQLDLTRIQLDYIKFQLALSAFTQGT